MLRFFGICFSFPPPDRPKFHVFFSLSRSHLRSFSLSPRTPNVHISGPGASNTTKIPREDPQREKKSENGGGREKKKREIGRGKEQRNFVPHLSGPHPSSPNPWGPNFFKVWAPPLCTPNPSGGGPPGLHFFLGLGPMFLIFIMVLICSFFSAFLIVSISCHFFFFWNFHCFCFFWFFVKKFFFFQKKHFPIFQVGKVRGGANPNPKLVCSLGEGGRV